MKKNEDGKPMLCRVQKFLVQVIIVPSSNKWEGPCDVYSQKMRHKMIVSHWCCGEGESHMVIQPLCRVWGGGENCSFHASERWCEKFKKLMSLHNLK